MLRVLPLPFMSLRLPAIPWVDDCRTRRVLGLLSLLWLLNLADLVFTLWAHHFTPFHEVNPVARSLLDNPAALVLFKLMTTATGTAIFWRLRPYARAEAALCGIVLVYVALAIRWADYTHDVAMMTGSLM